MKDQSAATITVTPLTIVSTKIQSLETAKETESKLKWNKVIEAELGKITKITDVATVQIPDDLSDARAKELLEQYKLGNWTMNIVTANGRVRYVQFFPYMDHQREVIKPS
jgi:hypothetical protein